VFGDELTKSLKKFILKISQLELSKIHKFKDIHKDESCYIFGDGTSLKFFDLNHFSDKVAIVNGLLPFHNEFDVLNAKYMLIAEPFWFYPELWTKYIKRNTISMPYISKAYREFINNNPDKQFFLNFSNFPVIRSKNINYFFQDILDYRLPENYISRRINAFTDSLRSSIIMATYMGFKKIYLVGCDYTHYPSRNNHWYEKGKGVFSFHENYQKEFFKIAKDFVDITTITLDGNSEFINSVTYKEYTGHDFIYRENTEMINDEYLKIMATWPGYSIF